ncbi:biotin-dependent carboxyltransferase family protein [Neptuniibacter sp. 1_MG-2023]|uniref:5-oxoprolinase subunit C family protein n=1 Tax=Neptuniibacter sp. 1_MG-2023 TaxID=3062662 RepID=UPI0026E28849|nr:biotin-dependent carboxyltransferase family protein [Neptuniibacter sp. 1_MG-2023]MDO6594564.1 biotin-dependent carboxyltransferase family protein [Neptuniibacter sp. 1_MG-2023]
MSGFKVLQPGLLTLIQDAGRFGHHRIGLTTGGPLDAQAFKWANRLLGNALNSTLLEVSIGGLVLESEVDTHLVVTGAEMPLKINGVEQDRWHAHHIHQGDRIELGFSTQGARAYLAVTNGFNVEHSFSSSSTVSREGIGGLNGGKLQQGDYLRCEPDTQGQAFRLAEHHRPSYTDNISLRVITGYQEQAFSDLDKRMFFSSEYEVTNRADRMGYRLSGPEIEASMDGILSEGICHGAIQIPADGQPIVLLNDRQTIGGYPKIGSMISLDTARLAQQLPGSTVSFEEISIDEAHNLHCLAHVKFERTTPENIGK